MDRSGANRSPLVVIDRNGLQGMVVNDADVANDAQTRLLVRFHSGHQVLVPKELFHHDGDGRYRLTVSVDELLAGQAGSSSLTSTTQSANAELGIPLVIPVTEETVRVQKQTVETGRVEIRKTVHERTEAIDFPLRSEEVEVERVAINQIVDEPSPVRNEGDTTIIPVFEEVLVVEKRLVLREEVHIKKLHKEVHEPQEVQLREERVEIVRKSGTDQDSTHEPL